MLRATDVIPPFDKEVAQPGDGEALTKPSAPVGAKQGGNRGEPQVGSGDDLNPAGGDIPEAEGTSAAFVEVPTLDLAEHILAEQRRTAARRRRAPRQGAEEHSAPIEQPHPRPQDLEPSAQDLLELQRIVAEIVSRDIERLCKRPDASLRSA